MKFVGIVRSFDALGRLVIPKEMRETMLVKAGDPLEITMEKRDGGLVILIRQYLGQSVTEPHLRILENAVDIVSPGRRDEYKKALMRVADLLEESGG